MHLEGKTALVTGGARGIGLGLCRALVAEGASIVVADLGTSLAGDGSSEGPVAEAAAVLEDQGGQVLARSTDVTDPGAVGQLMVDAHERFGSVDMVVNAAGILTFASLEDTDEGLWRRTIDVHLTGAFNVIKAVWSRWQQAGSAGAVINVSSDSWFLGEPTAIPYSTAKAGVIGLTRSIAPVLGELGGSANVLIPQAETRMTRQIPTSELPDPERWERGEFAPANVAPVVVYLGSDEGRWVNGRVIGGFGFELHRYQPGGREVSTRRDEPWSFEGVSGWMTEVFGEEGPA